MLIMLLAPLAAAATMDCDCVHGDGAGAELGAVPCCSIAQQCCFEHGQEDPAAPVVADLSRHSRMDPKENLSAAICQLLPARAAQAVLEYYVICDTEPIHRQLLERSWCQIWLI